MEKRKKKKSNAGRPPKMNSDVRAKIEEASAMDCTITEIALYAGIGRRTLYDWIKADPELSHRIEELRDTPFLKARKTLISNLNNPQYALEYLKRKKRKEFGDSRDITSQGEKLSVVIPEAIAQKNAISQKSRETSEE